jgi:hypothetical protein
MREAQADSTTFEGGGDRENPNILVTEKSGNLLQKRKQTARGLFCANFDT